MTEQLVIAPLNNGVVADGPLHEPALFKMMHVPNGVGARQMTFAERLAKNNGIPPYEWPAKCGVLGIVYAKGGPLARRAMCADCASGIIRFPVRPLAPACQWTRDDVIALFQEYESAWGRPPAYDDWGRERPAGAPAIKPILALFGSWRSAVRAAGFEPRRGGYRRVA